ncbi:hypothetical protein KAR91_03470 [Candidatus Pacearchaeota archaeon]|nr:hypothetical protein [Candidatus Pacearchaeota archaeon]
MSSVKVTKGAPPPVTPASEIPFNITRETLNNQLGNSKRRVSQRKGELADALSDAITQEYAGISNMCLQLLDYATALKKEISELKAKPQAKDQPPK